MVGRAGGGRTGVDAVSGKTGADAVGDDRRQHILRAAVEVLRERGFPDTRVADVAKRAEVSAALVMYYFESKDQLLTAALRFSEDIFYSAAARSMAALPTAQARLEQLVKLNCLPGKAGAAPSDSWVLWLDIWSQAFRHPGVARDRYELDQRWRDMLAGIVRDGQASGEFRDVDAEEFATWFCALMDGLVIQVTLRDPVVSAERAFDSAMRLAADQLGFVWSAPVRRARARSRRR